MSIETWMPVLMRKIAEVRGMEKVYSYNDLPGSLQVFPCSVIMPTAGAQTYSAGGPALAWHDVQMNVFAASQFLPEGMATAIRLLIEIRNKLAANVTLDGAVNFILPLEPPGQWYEGPGRLNFGDKVHTGLILRFTVKETEIITVSQ